MKRLLVGACAALAVLLAALPAAAQTVPEPGLLRGKPLREYNRPDPWSPLEPTENYHTAATDGDMSTRLSIAWRKAYRYTWDVPMRITRLVLVYTQTYARQGYLEVHAFDQDGNILWSQELPRATSITTQVYDVDLRRVGSLMVYRDGSNGFLYLYELEAYGEPEALPPPPTGLRAMPGDTEVTIAWDAVAGADSYDVAMRPADTGEDWQMVVTGLTDTMYTVTGLENDRPYEFRVRSVIGDGLAGDWSEPVTATPTTPAPPPPPPPPTDVLAVPGDGQVTVSWSPVEGADSYDLDDRPADGRWNVRARGLTDTRFTVTGLSNGVPYEFRLRSVGPGGPGDWSEPVTATPRAPARWGWFGRVVSDLPDYLGNAVGGIGPIVLIPAAVTLVTALGKWWLARMGI